ncbi:MAG: hypothetical protein PHS96_14215 [Anaerolineales bacterium]|nr:hypothetical protein [Anaerolineales bacterium]
MSEERRGAWFLLTGLIIGAVLGLFYAWVVQPVQYTNTAPASLRADFKDRYRALIALAYSADGDLVRARARLELLEDDDSYRSLAEQAQRTLAEGGSADEARALGKLASALKEAPAPPVASLGTTIPLTITLRVVDTPPAGTLTATQTSAVTPLPTRTATAAPGGPYVLTNRELRCEQDFGAPLIQVFVFNSSGQQVPAVEVVVLWEGGENHFYTGLKPDVGPGYADFTMTPEITYTLRLAVGGQTISDLVASECEGAGDGRFWGVWRLEFVQR